MNTLSIKQFGAPSVFALECVHEPIPNENGWVFGRMCLWVSGLRLGNFDEPACMLNVTAGQLQDVMDRLPDLQAPAFERLTDAELHRLLRQVLYGPCDGPHAEVLADAQQYRRFEFLTNGGESFDRFTSFIALSNGQVRILFTELASEPIGAHVDATTFVAVVAAFLEWMRAEAVLTH
ncbi:hypothetical protein ACS5PK_05480 [Roseateles sp. DB2]|uniref:hypothetical protein n=1 Tax=Roseateles sp. DB2 TaxID=3453717 RepID=UPI003EEE526C